MFLSPSGKAIIINHILESQALHIFAALQPPKTILKELEVHFSNFFGGKEIGKIAITRVPGARCVTLKRKEV